MPASDCIWTPLKSQNKTKVNLTCGGQRKDANDTLIALHEPCIWTNMTIKRLSKDFSKDTPLVYSSGSQPGCHREVLGVLWVPINLGPIFYIGV